MSNKYYFRVATVDDAVVITELVCELTAEITAGNSIKLARNIQKTNGLCADLMAKGQYAAILVCTEDQAIAVATFVETYALYAGGKMGVIQECYVRPEYRSNQIGTQLLDKVKQYGKQQGWECIELCTPPLPQFDRTLEFYEKNGLVPVGGRKMREHFINRGFTS